MTQVRQQCKYLLQFCCLLGAESNVKFGGFLHADVTTMEINTFLKKIQDYKFTVAKLNKYVWSFVKFYRVSSFMSFKLYLLKESSMKENILKPTAKRHD